MGIFRSLAQIFQRRTVRTAEVIVHGADNAHGGVRGPLVIQQYGRVWDLPDRDTAMREAEMGNYLKVAQLFDSMRADGRIRGLLGTRGAGMVALPKLFEGDPWVVDKLRGQDGEYDEQTGACTKKRIPGMFSRLAPTAELVAMLDDAIMGGAGIGYLDDDPKPGGWRKLRHLDLHYLTYRHDEDEFYYQDRRRGLLKVTPGDGRWVLLLPYGRHRPWTRGAWYPCAGPFISKQGAVIDRARWSRFLADGLRVLEMGENASETHLQEMVRFMRTGWQYAGGLVAPKGYKPDIVESNGKGFEVYCDTEDRGDVEIMVALAGQIVTTEGTSGFGSGDIHRDIAANLVQTMAEVTGEWIVVEILDLWTQAIGLGTGRVSVTWDARDPAQRQAAAEAAKAAADGLTAMDQSLAPRGKRVKAEAYYRECGVVVELEDLPGAAPALPAAPAPALPGAGGPPLLPAAAPQLAADTGEELTDDAAAALAEKMTEHGIERCPHERPNRCPLCGIERMYDFTPGKKGQPHVWRIAWRPITKSAPAVGVRLLASGELVRRVGPLTVVVECPEGSTRSGTGPDGPWSITMTCDYGRIPGTMSPDGEAADAYVGPELASGLAFVVSQVTIAGDPDEPKVMLGFPSADAALGAYLGHVPAWCFGGIEGMAVDQVIQYLAGTV